MKSQSLKQLYLTRFVSWPSFPKWSIPPKTTVILELDQKWSLNRCVSQSLCPFLWDYWCSMRACNGSLPILQRLSVLNSIVNIEEEIISMPVLLPSTKSVSLPNTIISVVYFVPNLPPTSTFSACPRLANEAVFVSGCLWLSRIDQSGSFLNLCLPHIN